MFSVTEIFVPHKEQQAEGEPRLFLSVLHKFYLFFYYNNSDCLKKARKYGQITG